MTFPDWSRERVLVTGAGGVLGTALVSELSGGAGVAPDRLFALHRADCDLLDTVATKQLLRDINPSLVFHLAGQVSGIQGNISFAGEAYYKNALINLNVIEAARGSGARKVVAAGTAAIYPDGLAMPMKERDIRNGAPHGSEAAYASAKLGMLAQLEAYQKQYGMQFAYLICTNLFGPNDRFDEEYGHVVPSLISRFHRAVTSGAKSISIWGDGTPTRDFLYAGDAARAFVAAAERFEGAANAATGSSVPIRKLVETIADVSGFQGEIVWDSSKPNGQLVRSYSVERLFSIGWRPATTLREGVDMTYQWYSGNQGNIRR
ncbi:MAG: NAD-dependent epimerase/dehydratase family protein [Rhizobiales bacterium]|nr:NAD-dependent epimerase/dehydratase family protein [Hyphomicrobiales bacterium]